VIRQAISCDICATEKRQTNHWFVAYEQNGELRVSGWSSRHKLRPETKHLCGQICLHTLVDEFMAKSIAIRSKHTEELPDHPANFGECKEDLPMCNDTSLTSPAAYPELESSARLITTPTAPTFAALNAPASRPANRLQSDVVTMPSRPLPADHAPRPSDSLSPSPRISRAEAWERERNRELRAAENRTGNVARR